MQGRRSLIDVSKKPAPDPIPGDFDQELAGIDPGVVQRVAASDERSLVVQFTVRGDAAIALERIADERGEEPGEVVASLIRAASA